MAVAFGAITLTIGLKHSNLAKIMGDQLEKRSGRRTLEWGLLSGSVGPRIRLLRNSLYSRSIATSEPFGLPTGSLTLMCLISANPGSSQADLAEYAGITGPRLVSVFDELERRGLVQRTRSETDRRRNLMSLTPKGERTMQTLYSEVKHIEDAIRDELGGEDLARFIDYLDRSVAALSREDGSSD